MRLFAGIVPGICLASLTVASLSNAQGYPSPPGPGQPSPYPSPAPPDSYGQPPPAYSPQAPQQPQQPQAPQPWDAQQQPGGQPPAPVYGPSGPPAGSAPQGAPAGAAAAGAGASLGAAGASAYGASKTELGDDEQEADASDEEIRYRRESLKLQNNLDGATGLLHMQAAGSGAPGTFRFSLTASYFAGSGFLCPACEVPGGGDASQASDSAKHIGGHLGIGVTPLSFLEAYMGIHTTASTNDRGRPELLQVLGDTNLGVKGFMPYERDSIFSAGGSAEVLMLNGVGGVGIDNANFTLRGLATLDLDNRIKAEDRIPLRAHVNVGYRFDNSGKLVDDVEKRNGARISRIQRFGLDINRVDSMLVGVGVEGVFDIVRPFIEWNVDVPVNRQNHVCDIRTRATGDQCLGQAAGFSTTPSRLTLGARAYPWLDGLAFLAALDIGTGATSQFIEEVAPELPWNVYLGIAYAADTKPHVQIKKIQTIRIVPSESGAQKVSLFILGTVVEKGSNNPIPDAIVKFDGRNLSGMVTRADGTFRTIDLDPDTYTFAVSAAGYRDGQCAVTLAPPMPGAPGGGPPGSAGGAPVSDPNNPYGTPNAGAPVYGAPPGPYGTPPAPSGPGAPGQPTTPGQPGGAGEVPTATVTCELEAQPKVGNVNGQVRDAENNAAVGGAAVKITDKLGRSLALTSDAAGTFRFENVPPGVVTIEAEAPNYLRGVIEVEVKSRGDVPAQVVLTKRPTKPNVIVTPNELKLKKDVHFKTDSAEITPDSAGIIAEIADTLRAHPEIFAVEVQGHTDDQGPPDYNLQLSSSRANAVREALVRAGVTSTRLTARGYGLTKPLVPNTNDGNRLINRRVQLIIVPK
jgi:outer membrane protein OmpA-like peptidoglycan-associated protein